MAIVINGSPLCASFNLTPSVFAPDIASSPRHQMQIGVIILGSINIIISLLLFTFFRPYYEHLLCRSFALVGLSTSGTIIHMTISFSAYTLFPVPDWLDMAGTLLIVPLMSITVPIRLFNFYGRFIFSRAIAKASLVGLHGQVSSDIESGGSPQPTAAVGQREGRSRSQDSLDPTMINDILVPRKSDELDPGHAKTASFDFDGNSKAFKSAISEDSSVHRRSESTDATPEIGGPRPKSHRNREVYIGGKKVVISKNDILVLRFLASGYPPLILMALFLLPYVIVIIVNIELEKGLDPQAGCIGVPELPANEYVIIGGALLSIFLGIFGALAVRKFPDPFLIARECRWYVQYGGTIALIGYIITLTPAEPPDPQPFSFQFLISLGLHMMLFTATTLQVYLAMKRTHPGGVVSFEAWRDHARRRARMDEHGDTHASREANHTNEEAARSRANTAEDDNRSVVSRGRAYTSEENMSTSGLSGYRANKKKSRLGRTVTGPRGLLSALNDPKIAEAFENHLVAEFSVEILRMYIECRKYEISFFDSSEATRRTRAKQIARTFIQIDSIFQVNLPESIRESLEQNILGSTAPLTPDLFREAENEMLLMMDGAFMRFRETEAYKLHHFPETSSPL